MRALGASGLLTPPLILGGNVFGWTADEAESFRVMDAFVAGGGTMIDTADVYSAWAPGHVGGESEGVIGRWLNRRRRRQDVLIATKVGFLGGLSRSSVERAIDESLRRLQTDYIDLYYAHRDYDTVPLEETLEAFDGLVRAGKVRQLGASQIEPERLEQALEISDANGWERYPVLQACYSIVERPRFEGALRRDAPRHNLGVATFYSLANGYLTGKYRSADDLSKSVRGDRVAGYMHGEGPAVLAILDEIAHEAKATPAQVALAWTAAQPGVTAPLASATSVVQLQELLGSLHLELTEDQLKAVSAVG